MAGQDKIYADYLVSSHSKFCIIEFKYNDSNFKDESRKPLRKNLCEKLNNSYDLLKLHCKAHFIGWMSDLTIRLDIYSNIICDNKVFNDENCHTDNIESIFDGNNDSKKFAKSLLSSRNGIGLGVKYFDYYLNELNRISGEGEVAIELLISDSQKGTVSFKPFTSISALAEWHNEKIRQLDQSKKPKGPSSRGGPTR